MILNHYRGFSSFDAMFSLIPLTILLLFVMNISSDFVHMSVENTHKQQVFNKLVSIADYTVKSGGVRRDGEIKRPNWLDPGQIGQSYTESLRERAGLSQLAITLDEPDEDLNMCIYRLVVIGNEKKITRLFVCGE